MDGEVSLADLRDHGLELIHPDVTTISNLVLAHHGRLPTVGTTVTVPGHRVLVESIDGRRITRVTAAPAPCEE